MSERKIPGVRCASYQDEGHFYLTIELHGGFAIVASLCRDTGEVRCELWDDRNSITQHSDQRGLRMTPFEFLEWREVACGYEPREYFGAHYRTTHKEELDARAAQPPKTVAQIEAHWEARRREEGAKTPAQKAADWEKYKAEQAAREAARDAEIKEQIRALQADGVSSS